MAFVSSHLCTLITSLSECCKCQFYIASKPRHREPDERKRSIKAVEELPCIRLVRIGRGGFPLP